MAGTPAKSEIIHGLGLDPAFNFEKSNPLAVFTFQSSDYGFLLLADMGIRSHKKYRKSGRLLVNDWSIWASSPLPVEGLAVKAPCSWGLLTASTWRLFSKVSARGMLMTIKAKNRDAANLIER